MASNTMTGAYAVYIGLGTSSGRVALSAFEIDQIAQGKIPTSSGCLYQWSRLFTSADDSATLECTNETLELKTQEEGIRSVVMTQPDTWKLTVPVADVAINTFRKLLQLNPSYASSSGNGLPLDFAQTGNSLTTYAYPVIIYNKYYGDGSTGNDINIPKVGTGSDPNAFVFTKGSLAERNMQVQFSPTAQQAFNVVLGFYQTTGATASVGGYFGTLSASSSS